MEDASPFSDFDAPEMLIWGENLGAMHALPGASTQLIYADPPFFTNRRYNHLYRDREEPVFSDTWTEGIDSYLSWLKPRLVEMRRLLTDSGSIYVHLDWHASHYVKVMMDGIFGYRNFLNEVIWHYRDPAGTVKDRFKKKHDTILLYAKNAGKHLFNLDAVRTDYSPGTLHQGEQGVISFGRPTKLHRLGKVREDVWDIPIINSQAKERMGYPTQKPAMLLQTIVKASSSPGDRVADFFCGSGTLPFVARRLDRKWTAADISGEAVRATLGRVKEVMPAGASGGTPRLLTIGVTRTSPLLAGRNSRDRGVARALCLEMFGAGTSPPPRRGQTRSGRESVGRSSSRPNDGWHPAQPLFPHFEPGNSFLTVTRTLKDGVHGVTSHTCRMKLQVLPSPYEWTSRKKCIRIHSPPSIDVRAMREDGSGYLQVTVLPTGDGVISSATVEVRHRGKGPVKRILELSWKDLESGAAAIGVDAPGPFAVSVKAVDSSGSSASLRRSLSL